MTRFFITIIAALVLGACSLIVEFRDYPVSGNDAGNDAGIDAGPCTQDATQPCYDGPPGTAVGLCREGFQACDDQGAWGTCLDQVTPAMRCELRECGTSGCNTLCGDCEIGVTCDATSGTCLRGEMALVVSQAFLLGSPPEENPREADEQATQVVVSTFRIDRAEVTNQAYRQCVLAEACEAPTQCDSGTPVWISAVSYLAEYAHHPVTCVTWQMAADYCTFAQKRLCTEAEWELACIEGAEHRTYPWDGDWVDDGLHANCSDAWCFDAHATTASVRSFALGQTPGQHLFDLAGNVSEWVLDAYAETYDSTENPQGPCGGAEPCTDHPWRVHRGGGYNDQPDKLRCSSREQMYPYSKATDTGIRCCQDE